MIELYGEEKAFRALENTYNTMKKEVKEKEKSFWNSIRYEILKRNGSVPCSNRDLKSMIKNKEIDIAGLTQETKIKKIIIYIK